MAKKVETKVEVPQLDVNDVAVLYTLAQQANIKVSDVPTVSPVLDKCLVILNSVNQKVNG